MLCTANLYRDLWGFYREMGVQGFHICRVSLGIKLPVNVTVNLRYVSFTGKSLQLRQNIYKTLKLDDYMDF